VLGIGLGSDRTGEFDPERFGEEGDPKARALLLDRSLERLQGYWAGEFEPGPVDRIPVWAAARWPARKPLRRAARLDGVFPIDLPGPDALAELVGELRELRGPLDGYDVVVTNPAGTDPAPWIAAGATWCLSGFGPTPTWAEVERAIDAR
jgi:hypothetical protein